MIFFLYSNYCNSFNFAILSLLFSVGQLCFISCFISYKMIISFL
ncbi:putative membrane protein [Synechococcus sp. WH 8103]|nr:putative membrane protein [Synechococcus sp. WH 8103]